MRWRDEGSHGEERTGYGRWDEEKARHGEERPDPEEEPAGQSPEHRCEICGAPMIERHCKILCLRCGYQRDCSDP